MRISDWSSDVCSSDLTRSHVHAWHAARPKVGQDALGVLAIQPVVEDQDDLSVVSAGLIGVLDDERCVQPAIELRSSSEERSVGKEWVSTGRSRWSPYH